MYTQPPTKVVVYSTGQRASTLLLGKIKEYYQVLSELYGEDDSIQSCGQEVMEVKNKRSASSKVSCYPSSEEVSQNKNKRMGVIIIKDNIILFEQKTFYT